jgi:hypothetical protein
MQSPTEPSSDYTGFILRQLRCAGLRARLIVNQIDSIGIALRDNFIGPDDAIAWLHEAGALGLIVTSPSSAGV